MSNAFSCQVKCCETLIFPVEKLPCRCYYNYLIDQRPFNCRDRKGDKIHRQDGLQNSLMRMMEVMKRARRLDICMMNLALWELAHFLILMKERSNTAIRIVADGGKEFKRGTQLAKLLKIGVQVKIPTSMENNSTQANRGKTIMHHKFAIIDSDAAIMGSLNWTRSGVLHNREAVLITRNKNAISVLSKEFDLMWEQYENATQELFEEMSLGNP